MNMYRYTHTCTYAADTHTYRHKYTQIHSYTRTHTHAYVRLHTCIPTYICTYVRDMHTYLHMHIHKNYTYIRASPSLRLCSAYYMCPRSQEFGGPIAPGAFGRHCVCYICTRPLQHQNVQVWTDMTAGSNGMSSTRTSYTIQTEIAGCGMCLLATHNKHDTRSFLCPDTSRNWLQPVRSCTHQATLEHQRCPPRPPGPPRRAKPYLYTQFATGCNLCFLVIMSLSPDGRSCWNACGGATFFCWRTSTLAHSLHCTPNARTHRVYHTVGNNHHQQCPFEVSFGAGRRQHRQE